MSGEVHIPYILFEIPSNFRCGIFIPNMPPRDDGSLAIDLAGAIDWRTDQQTNHCNLPELSKMTEPEPHRQTNLATSDQHRTETQTEKSKDTWAKPLIKRPSSDRKGRDNCFKDAREAPSVQGKVTRNQILYHTPPPRHCYNRN
ncbi:unnamed protein product [Microthlaspi erraticum]|uniref:Uncharacterized protein n=1 Tax=Microthlaspi erraticum TaxID=1685480 RepID=A0A6D2L8J4_9BRAS|nr:unnamed protein product [Microthlaspi erraticum]